jgi:hypothetical protein
MQKHHSAQRYLLAQYLAWFNIWRRCGKSGSMAFALMPIYFQLWCMRFVQQATICVWHFADPDEQRHCYQQAALHTAFKPYISYSSLWLDCHLCGTRQLLFATKHLFYVARGPLPVCNKTALLHGQRASTVLRC